MLRLFSISVKRFPRLQSSAKCKMSADIAASTLAVSEIKSPQFSTLVLCVRPCVRLSFRDVTTFGRNSRTRPTTLCQRSMSYLKVKDQNFVIYTLSGS